MSRIRGQVGEFDFELSSPPRGDAGTVTVKIHGAPSGASQPGTLELRWIRDAQGIWIETPRGVTGFDLRGIRDEGVVTYEVSERTGPGSWTGLRFLRAGEAQASTASGSTRSAKSRIRAQMPGKIVRVLVRPGDRVEKDQPLLVMEAMKMENEIRAPNPGTVGDVKVTEGQAVDSGADLITMS